MKYFFSDLKGKEMVQQLGAETSNIASEIFEKLLF